MAHWKYADDSVLKLCKVIYVQGDGTKNDVFEKKLMHLFVIVSASIGLKTSIRSTEICLSGRIGPICCNSFVTVPNRCSYQQEEHSKETLRTTNPANTVDTDTTITPSRSSKRHIKYLPVFNANFMLNL